MARRKSLPGAHRRAQGVRSCPGADRQDGRAREGRVRGQLAPPGDPSSMVLFIGRDEKWDAICAEHGLTRPTYDNKAFLRRTSAQLDSARLFDRRGRTTHLDGRERRLALPRRLKHGEHSLRPAMGCSCTGAFVRPSRPGVHSSPERLVREDCWSVECVLDAARTLPLPPSR